MVMRLRRSGRTGQVALIVTLALGASAWLAFGVAQPSGGSYPTTAAKVKGQGAIGSGMNRTGFEFDVKRDAAGHVKGHVNVQCPKGAPKSGGRETFHSVHITSLVVAGNTATFAADGKATLKANEGRTFTATVRVTDDSPDTFSVSIPGTAKPCDESGPLTHGNIKIK